MDSIYRYDYSRTMMMKMLLAKPDKNGGSNVFIDFDKALDIIKAVDNITQGMKKIIYLVGWQNNGHDDKYPDIFEVNKALKGKNSDNAYDSLINLINEAKKYNTVISFHVNFNDVYDNAPSFTRYLNANALIRRRNGKPHAIERYNGKNCYKASFKELWESGIFKEHIDRFLSFLPIEEIGTLHVDNFQCYTNYSPYISIDEMCDYREKMIDYLRAKNIDITTEFTLREDNSLPNVKLFRLPREHNPESPIRILGKIPAVWWLTYISDEELVDIVPDKLCGGLLRRGTHNDNRNSFIYGNIHGEECFDRVSEGDDVWHDMFLHDFATVQVPFSYLSRHKRISVEGKKGDRRSVHEDGIISFEKNRRITCGESVIKENDNLCMPLVHLENTYIAYSSEGDERIWNLGIDKSCETEVYEIRYNDTVLLGKVHVNNGNIRLKIDSRQGLIIKLL